MSNTNSGQLVRRNSDESTLAQRDNFALSGSLQDGDTLAVDSDSPSENSQGLNLARFHSSMRGRYPLAIALLLIGACVGAFVGFKSGKKVYASVGLIRVKSHIPDILFTDPEKGDVHNITIFMDSQATLLQSQRVLGMAMDDPAWQAVGRGTSDSALDEFAKELTVTAEGEVLKVQVADADPKAAVAGASSLIRAYQKIYNEQDAQSDQSRIDFLRTRQTSLSSDLASKRQRILDIAKPYGSDDLRSLYQFKQEQINKLESTLADEQIHLAQRARNPNDPKAPQPKELSDDELALLSPQLTTLMNQARALAEALEGLKALNLGSNHPKVKQAASALSMKQAEVKQFADALRKRMASGSIALGSNGDLGNDEALTADKVKALENLRDNKKKELIAMGRDMLDIENLRAEAKDVETDRNETQHRIDMLTVEATNNTRIEVLSEGDRPLQPYKNYQIPLCAAGGFGGGFLGFGIVAMVALMDRRMRSPDQAEGGRLTAPILGMLPRLPDNLTDPVQAALAAHCVHRIRTLLQIWGRQSRHRVFAITSPQAAAGKTSLTLALGASYATSNLRTLIVDCDFVAAGLTRRVNVVIERDLAEIIQQEGLVDDERLAEAVQQAGPKAGPLGKALLKRGLISVEQLKKAVAQAADSPIGILDALEGAPIKACVADTGVPNLQIMPVGRATARDVPLLSPEALHQLIDTLGEQFDVVLVDTGPILGSLEASLVAGIVDGVVLTVVKGNHRPILDKAMSQLVMVGARVAGMVFNGASSDDIMTYGSIYGSGSTDQGTHLGSIPATTNVGAGTFTALVPSGFGPLSVAVASCAPTVNHKSPRVLN